MFLFLCYFGVWEMGIVSVLFVGLKGDNGVGGVCER